MKPKIAIVASTLAEPWGGSEELWSQAATRLVEEGVTVAASMHGWLPLHDRVRDLMHSGVKLWLRPQRYPLLKRLRRRMLSREDDCSFEVERFLNAVSPNLVVLSTGGVLPTIEWIEFCRWKGLPFVTIGQANSEYWWFDDKTAARYREGLSAAIRCFFVSKANLQLAEKQIGGEIPNGEVVCESVQCRHQRCAAVAVDGRRRATPCLRRKAGSALEGPRYPAGGFGQPGVDETALVAHSIWKRPDEEYH